MISKSIMQKVTR